MCRKQSAQSPVRGRSEFGRERMATIRLDHCFLGSADDAEGRKAHESPFFIFVDSETEAIYALAVADKACKLWAFENVSNVLSELGYVGVNVALKSDAAPELRELKKLGAAKRSSPTVPLEVPVRESKANGAVGRAVRTWQGQFRTLKSHPGSGIDFVLSCKHPIFQWCAW